MIRKAAFSLFTAAAIAATVPPANAADQKPLVIATPVDVQSWDPMATNSSQIMPILRSVFDAPLNQSPELELIPNVIEEWTWSDDGLALNVTLRDDVTFHNGDRLTTEDLRFSYFERFQEDTPLPFAGVFKPFIKDIEIVSDTDAIIHLNKPMPALPSWMAFLGQFIVPKDYFTEVGRDEFMAHPVGSGPYKLAEYDRGSRIVLKAFDDYWNGKPEIDTLIFEIVKDPSARVAAIQSGAVDIASSIPIREAQRLDTMSGITARIEPISSIIMMHASNTGAFTDKNIRLAANAAIDKKALSEAFFGGAAVPIVVPGTPLMPGYPQAAPSSYDPDRAKNLLAQSGYGPDKPVEIGLVTTNGAFANDYEIARAVAGMWAQVGIKANIEVVELAKYHEMNAANMLPEATLVAWNNSTNDPELYLGSILDPDVRFSAWKSDDMGDLIAPLKQETDLDKRISGYAEAAAYAMEQGYTIPLLQSVETVAYKDGIDFTWFANTWYEPYRISRD